MKILFRTITVCLLFTAAALAGTRIDLNNSWSFRTDPDGSGEASGWTKLAPSGTETVNVPHTWNRGKHEDYEGVAWYFRSFEIPAELLGKHVELNFGATFYSSRVWVNGVEVGGHEGGYTAYHLDLSGHLQRMNYVAVALDNRPGPATIPGLDMRGDKRNLWYDWWHYGGIVRDVWLTVYDPVLLRRQQIRTEMADTSAIIHDRVFLESTSKRDMQVSVRATAFDRDGNAVATAAQSISVPAGSTNKDEALAVAVKDPRLWDIDHANVYRMQVEVSDSKGKLLDRQSDTFGIRTIEIRDRHLLINGQRVRLSGMTRHEDSPQEGLAETAGTIRHDYDDMKALQVTLTRPVHYPQNPLIFDYADRHGILFIPEIPVWQFSEKQLSDPKVLALAKQQMREMIEQDGNHPSIFAWSVCNESEAFTPGGHAYVLAMKKMINEIDPGRLVSYADDSLPALKQAEGSTAADADFLMMNQYFGSWHGPASALAPALDKIGKMFPDKMLIISEFGMPGLFLRNSAAADQGRIEIMHSQMEEFSRHDWIGGAIFWCYQDYKSHRNLWPGRQEGYVDHGVVDENYQRRPSYDVWKQLNAPATVDLAWKRRITYIQFLPVGFEATITPNSPEKIPSYALRDYQVRWEIRDENLHLVASGEQTLPGLDGPAKISGDLPAVAGVHELKLRVTLLRPSGFSAAESILSWNSVESGGQTADQMKIAVPKD